MKRTHVTNGVGLFGTPPENLSVATALSQLKSYISLYGLEKAKKGALGESVLSWMKNTDQSIEVDACESIKRAPVLFEMSYQGSDPARNIGFIFTGEGVYRLKDDGKKIIGNTGAMVVVKVVPVSIAELRDVQRLIPCLGQDLALEFNCMLWRIEHNPRDFSSNTE